MSIIATRRAWIAGAAALAVAGRAKAQALQEVPIALAGLSLVSASARIANEMALFQKHGIQPKFTILDSANAADAALIAGSVRAAVSGPGELVMAQAHGQKVVALVNTYAGLGASMTLGKSVAEKLGVSPKAPIKERLKALDGLLIASTTPTSSYTVALKAATQWAGANIKLTYMSQQAMVAALEAGNVQGFFTSAPFWAIPLVRGYGVQWFSGPGGELPSEFAPKSSVSLQVMRDYAEANPDLMKRLVAVFDDLTDALNQRPADVKAAVARLYPELDAQTLDLLFANESPAWKAGHFTPADIAHEIEFVKAAGVTLPAGVNLDPRAMLYP
jgi:ABC-type nitrate/sulfonate/bicarbonate transport system substrate-binding protein